MGEVITFYSFKGGVGRSMGLANVAALYAQRGKRVIALDFDFEAPGLHRYFLSPREEGGSLRHKPMEPRRGVLNYLRFVYDELQKSFPNGEGFDAHDVQVRLRSLLAKWLDEGDYIYTIEIADPNRKDIPVAPQSVDFIAAARFDDTYPNLVRSFDWQRFYDVYAEVFPALAAELAQRYDIVLIDSRTGVTDIGSICTMVMPDKLVLAFTPNEQSLRGALDAGWQAIQGRQQLGRSPLHVYPLLSRLEDGEEKLKRKWIDRARHGFEFLFREGYGLPTCDLETYFNAIRVPHRGYYAYGERIAVEEQRTSETGTLAEVYYELANCLEQDGVLAAQEAIRRSGFSAEEAMLRSFVGMMQSGPLRDMPKQHPVSSLILLMNAEKAAQQGQTDDALRLYGEVIDQLQTFLDPASQGMLATALSHKARILHEKKGDHQAALGLLENIVSRFSTSKNPDLRYEAAHANLNMFRVWMSIDEHEKANRAIDKTIDLYSTTQSSPKARERHSEALLLKARSLASSEMETDALAILDELIQRFGKSPEEPVVRTVVAAMGLKMELLTRLGRKEEERAHQKEFIARLRDSDDARIRQLVGLALLADIKDPLESSSELLALVDDIISRLQGAEDDMLPHLSTAMNMRIIVLNRLERHSEALAKAQEWLNQFSSSQDPRIQKQVRRALCNAAVAAFRRAKQVWQTGDGNASQVLLDQAAISIEEARQRAPDHAVILENAAYVAFLQGRVEDSRSLLEKALSIDPAKVRTGALEDASVHPIPQDEAFRAMVLELAAAHESK